MNRNIMCFVKWNCLCQAEIQARPNEFFGIFSERVFGPARIRIRYAKVLRRDSFCDVAKVFTKDPLP